MTLDIIIDLVKKHTGMDVSSVTGITGGYRNKVYLATTESGDVILKKHRSVSDFKNEREAYKLFGECGCRIPKLLFTDPAQQVMGLQYLKARTLEDRQSRAYYLETVRLLADTYQKTGHLKDDGSLSFRRTPEELFEGAKLLERNAGFSPTPRFRSYIQQCYKLMTESAPRLIVGSFIPENVVRSDQDYHIDLEMASYGRPSDDLAYFSLFSGVNMFDVASATHTYFEIPDSLFLASLLHLSMLASGIYFADMQGELDKDKKQIVARRIDNFSSVLSNVRKPEFDELVAVLHRRTW